MPQASSCCTATLHKDVDDAKGFVRAHGGELPSCEEWHKIPEELSNLVSQSGKTRALGGQGTEGGDLPVPNLESQASDET